MKLLKKVVPTLRLLVLPTMLILSGCSAAEKLLCQIPEACASSTPPTNEPGNFSTYQISQFAAGSNTDQLCAYATETWCVENEQTALVPDLTSLTPPWTANQVDSVYTVNGAASMPLTASNIASDASNLVVIDTHGGIVNGVEQLCLYQCNGSTSGGGYSVGPGSGGIPTQWAGPNWLILWACNSVLPNIGWEGTFGGNLHGILGFGSQANEQMGEVPTMTVQEQTQLATSLGGLATPAITLWDQVGAVMGNISAMTALIPANNAADVIVAKGGPNFGPSGQTGPQFYADIPASGTLTVQPQTLSTRPGSSLSLTPEVMDESYWYNYYGGGNVPSVIDHPTANEDRYRTPYGMVDHYLASGGLLATGGETGTAQGFSSSEAYQYALTWLASNGGLPSDAVLTYAGEQTVTPTTAVANASELYPNVRHYTYIWRHATSGLLGGDHIEVNVDDAGHLTATTTTKVVEVLNPHCMCLMPETETYVTYGLPWIPVYNVNMYARMWRSLNGPITAPGNTAPPGTTTEIVCDGGCGHGGGAASPTPGSGSTATPSPTATPLPINASSYAYCGTDMSVTPSVATPCGMVNSSSATSYVDVNSGQTLGLTERL